MADDGLSFWFHVRYLREEPPETLLADPVLAPLAVLADVPDAQRPAVLRAAARRVLADGRPELLQATQDLAYIKLTSDIIAEVWKELPVPIPTAWQYRFEDGQISAISSALRERFGDDPRLPDIARRLAAEPDGWFKQVLAAGSLDDLA